MASIYNSASLLRPFLQSPPVPLYQTPKNAHTDWISNSFWMKRFASTAESDPLPVDLSASSNLLNTYPFLRTRPQQQQLELPDPKQSNDPSAPATSSKIVGKETGVPYRVPTNQSQSADPDFKTEIPNIDKFKDSYTRIKKFQCSACDKSYATKKTLRYHWAQSHNETSELHKCTVCSKKFTRRHHLEEHMRVHSGERPFSCHICNKSCNVVGNLRRHLRLHTELKPFQCTVCHKQFRQLGNYRTHYNIVHSNAKPFACGWCNQTYAIKCYLKRHQKKCKTANITVSVN